MIHRRDKTAEVRLRNQRREGMNDKKGKEMRNFINWKFSSKASLNV